MNEIIIASDHAGFALKSTLKQYLENKGYEVSDLGTKNTDSVDYPDYAHALATKIEKGKAEKAILICSSGVGVSITANRHPGVRAALCWEEKVAEFCRKHNNANVLCLPANYITAEKAKKITDTYLSTSFEGGRHERRVNKIER